MQINGIRADQITQVRGFADQRLRKPETPLDPSNRRISVIVQYQQKTPEEPATPSDGGEEARPSKSTKPGSVAEKGTKSVAAESAEGAQERPPKKN
jgi:chemotaxis protein MotB